MTRDEAVAAIDANWPTENYTMLREALTLAKDALRSRPAPPDDLVLRHAWEAGFRLCRSYGDNHHHFDGEQKERRWRDYIKGLAAPAPLASLAPPDDLVANQAYGYLSRLLITCAPQCQPLPDLLGLCSQIDNLIAGLRAPAPVAAPSVAQARDEMVEGLEAAGFFRAPVAAPAPETPTVAEWVASQDSTPHDGLIVSFAPKQHTLRTLFRFGDMFYTCSCGWEDFIDSDAPAVLKCPKSEDV